MARSYCGSNPNLWHVKTPYNQQHKYCQTRTVILIAFICNLENIRSKWNVPSQTSAPHVKRHQRARTGRRHPRVKFTWRFTGAAILFPSSQLTCYTFYRPVICEQVFTLTWGREGEAQQPQSLSGTPGAESNITSPTHHPPTTTKQRNKWCPKSRSSRQKVPGNSSCLSSNYLVFSKSLPKTTFWISNLSTSQWSRRIYQSL